MAVPPQSVILVRKLLAAGLAVKKVAAQAKVNANTVRKIRDNPHYPLKLKKNEPHGEEQELPKPVHFDGEGGTADIPQYERCVSYRGLAGCGGLKQVGKICIACRDRWIKLANADWETYLDELLGPTTSILPSVPPSPAKEIIMDEVVSNPSNDPDKPMVSLSKPAPPSNQDAEIIEEVRRRTRQLFPLHLRHDRVLP